MKLGEGRSLLSVRNLYSLNFGGAVADSLPRSAAPILSYNPRFATTRALPAQPPNDATSPPRAANASSREPKAFACVEATRRGLRLGPAWF